MNPKLHRLFVKPNGDPSLFVWFLLAMMFVVVFAAVSSNEVSKSIQHGECEARGGVYVYVDRIDGKTPAHTLCIKKEAVIQ